MIENTGKGLHIVIAAETAQDWPTFCCWYSAQKSLPDARITVIVSRTTRVEFQYFQWLKRLKIPHRYQNPKFRDQNVHRLQVASASWTEAPEATLVISPYVAFVSPLNNTLCEFFSCIKESYLSDNYCLLTGYKTQLEIASAIDKIILDGQGFGIHAEVCLEAKDTQDPWPILGYLKGCGNWIDNMTACPFSYASGMVSLNMTVNERKIIELWRRMVPLFSAVQ